MFNHTPSFSFTVVRISVMMINRISKQFYIDELSNSDMSAENLDTQESPGFLFPDDEYQFIQSLNEHSILSGGELKKIEMLLKSGKTDLSVVQLILNLGLISESDLLRHLSMMGRMRILRAEEFPSELYGKSNFNAQFLKQHHMVVVSETNDVMEICINDPFAKGLQQALSFAIGNKFLKIRLGFKKDIEEALERILMSKVEAFANDKFDEIDAVLLDRDIQQLKELASEAPVIKVVNAIIKDAIVKNSSDIHMEPQSHQLKIRNRIDGVLITVRELPVNMAAAVVSRIKILSDLDIAQRRVPQDGRLNMNIDGQDVDIRVSIMPTIHGESVVMRLLYKKSIKFDFDSLGYSEFNQSRIFQMLNKPHGLILVTGPTGSGKSTSLYAMLQQINDSEKKIVSVEDPVEYKIEGINQIQVNPEVGVSFANALRGIVRHDPEVIMVGEMRDAETASIAIRASMTGHLILTTLHTNSAVASIDRLLDLGVEKAFVFSSLIGVVAQRLVRKLCDHCKKPVHSSLVSLNSEAEDASITDQMGCFEPVGCEHCSNTGYKGRLSICEVMILNDDFRSDALAGKGSIQQLALKHGMRSMVIDGFEKVKSGQTTVDELYRTVLE